MLEGHVGRVTVAVVEVPSSPLRHEARPSELRRAPASILPRLTDDAAGPTTPRPSLALDSIPRVVADVTFIRLLPLRPRDAFCLAHLDGRSDLRTVVDISSMPENEVIAILEKLIDLGVVEV